MRYENHKFVGETLKLDENQFIGCSFEECVLVYEGGKFEVVPFTTSKTEIRLQGAALNTSQLISAIQSSKARAVPCGSQIEFGGVQFTRTAPADKD